MADSSDLKRLIDLRATAMEEIRAFFRARNVREVDTRSLSRAGNTDPNIASVTADLTAIDGRHYLHTSPEHAMKRLLAAGSGDICQITRVYRDGEIGRWHQPEFLMLEWYRQGFDEFALINEVFELLETLLARQWPRLQRIDISYRDAFLQALDIDPLSPDATTRPQLEARLAEKHIETPPDLDNDALLDLALATAIVPAWPSDTAIFLYHYPASQASLAALTQDKPPVASRFEVFINGLELGNGYRELTDATEQRQRFESDNETRRAKGLPELPIDNHLINALESGLPACAGVAVGIDRLIALRAGARSLNEVLLFPHSS